MSPRKYARLAVLLLAVLAGCGPARPAVTRAATPTIPAALTPYYTATASGTPAPAAPGTPTPLPSPTSTPRTHKVAAGEDMGGIAYRYQITLQELVAANPKVNPNAMSIGTVLVIPGSSGPAATSAAPSPTPVPLQMGQVSCTLGQDGGLWCFLPVRNNQKLALENVSAMIRVADTTASQVLSQAAFPPLDRIPAGASLPMVAYFPGPVPQPYQASAELLSSMPVPAGSGRYLGTKLSGKTIEIAKDGLSARATGQVFLAKQDAAARQVWVAAVAYDASGAVVGVRRWENKNPLAAGQRLSFDLNIYSVSAAISQVDLLVEARP